MANRYELLLSLQEVHRVLDYDPLTGIFLWKEGRRGRAVYGSQAGGLASGGYVVIRINYHKFLGHRLAWFYVYGVWPADQIDHKNGKRADNRICNLRESTQKENLRNRCIPTNNKTGVMGVHYDKARNQYMAYINIDGKFKNLGRFKKLDDAIIARQDALEKYEFYPHHGRAA